MKIVRTFVIVGVVLLTLRLACVQLVWGPELAAQAQNQRTREYTDFARRGTVTDRDGAQLAYTMQARSLTAAPLVLRREIQERHEMAVDSGDPEQLKKFPPVEDALEEMATVIPEMVRESGASVQKVKPAEILRKLQADNSYTVLVRNVDPDVAVEIAERFPGVAADRQDIRQYPNGAIAENVIGKISIDGEGQFGLEASADSVLSGINGKSTEDVSTNGHIIPGTLRDQVPVIHGSDMELTLDLDLQTYVQQQLEQAKENSRAKSASAVVLDSATGEVLAMANTGTIDPTGDIETQLAAGRFFGNPAIEAPFEPGSVAKIITASAAIEDGVTTPDEVLQVPGSINMAGVTVKDAWPHGVVPFTTTGVFGKSSNVGTLMLADRVGQDRFAEMLDKFGVGRYTGIELPGESQGLLLDRSQWSGGTFANLPIGQGMSLTLLQMAGVYQAIANDGERIQPRIIRSVTAPDGEVTEQPEPERIRVVSPETARTVREMFQAVTQRDPSRVQQGTGPQAAVEGYQIAGKTGTAQQVNPDCNCYSNSDYWITFAGIAPADDPRFVIALMLDDPERGVHGEGGQSAAPLFHDIAAWLLNRDNVPLSPPREGDLILRAQ
ncbi:penicillin-binding protein 2 [Corynebacterium sp. CCM 9185]|nr:penicillin-binding protein 2 [Corynebacterium marambiense]MCK7662867.1 penicillin-binding protein 2 [Corynebacterium marambiense]MCX7542476.1 penicillin-binding protein 2 [Corynebacterium marambiense]